MTTKPRTYEANGRKAEIIGPAGACTVMIDGASHPVFSRKFSSIRAARIRFLQWASNVGPKRQTT